MNRTAHRFDRKKLAAMSSENRAGYLRSAGEEAAALLSTGDPQDRAAGKRLQKQVAEFVEAEAMPLPLAILVDPPRRKPAIIEPDRPLLLTDQRPGRAMVLRAIEAARLRRSEHVLPEEPRVAKPADSPPPGANIKPLAEAFAELAQIAVTCRAAIVLGESKISHFVDNLYRLFAKRVLEVDWSTGTPYPDKPGVTYMDFSIVLTPEGAAAKEIKTKRQRAGRGGKPDNATLVVKVGVELLLGKTPHNTVYTSTWRKLIVATLILPRMLRSGSQVFKRDGTELRWLKPEVIAAVPFDDILPSHVVKALGSIRTLIKVMKEIVPPPPEAPQKVTIDEAEKDRDEADEAALKTTSAKFEEAIKDAAKRRDAESLDMRGRKAILELDAGTAPEFADVTEGEDFEMVGHREGGKLLVKLVRKIDGKVV